MSLLLEHPVRVYMLVQPERTVRISRGRRDERERGSERRVRRPGNAGGSEVSYTCEEERGCEGSTEGDDEEKGSMGQRLYGEEWGYRDEVRVERERRGVVENERVIRLIFQHREILPLNH